MNVKNINQFIQDIDKKQTLNWKLKTDCHPKIKKIVLNQEWILREKPVTKEIQITLENNPHHTTRGTTPEQKIKQHWELPHPHTTGETLDKQIIKAISTELDHPIYNGHHYKNGEKL